MKGFDEKIASANHNNGQVFKDESVQYKYKISFQDKFNAHGVPDRASSAAPERKVTLYPVDLSTGSITTDRKKIQVRWQHHKGLVKHQAVLYPARY